MEYISEFLILSLVKEISDGSTLVDEQVLKSLDGLSLLLSLDVLFLVHVLLGSAPTLLNGEGLLLVLKSDLNDIGKSGTV
jgi:hypothetical protein